MDKEDFCTDYCPIPCRWIEFPKIDDDVTIDCDLEENKCPFKNVDFSKVTINHLSPFTVAWVMEEKKGGDK